MNKNCQSCGMPMKRDPETGGTNADGSKNLKFSSWMQQEKSGHGHTGYDLLQAERTGEETV
ncbi:conserved hypothetical protein [Desulfamplus magnetovallimortis]|uniref:Putative zinc ribbon domain-containing protein n=1 Tax=Desulfamplus magnetovallimortis TaxID=1246637 RepID=A0A1W1HIS6_9BACT|nr:zinc ribbon domain-containing protein [Desulfamplus magnetovallimortis]SLM32350.1 conserved hypothetical protein [Desulfamplus magnetovallimortis]